MTEKFDSRELTKKWMDRDKSGINYFAQTEQETGAREQWSDCIYQDSIKTLRALCAGNPTYDSLLQDVQMVPQGMTRASQSSPLERYLTGWHESFWVCISDNLEEGKTSKVEEIIALLEELYADFNLVVEDRKAREAQAKKEEEEREEKRRQVKAHERQEILLKHGQEAAELFDKSKYKCFQKYEPDHPYLNAPF